MKHEGEKQEKRADKEHRDAIYQAIYDAISACCEDPAKADRVTGAIMDGEIPHVTVIL
jgi:hypothetical protein